MRVVSIKDCTLAACAIFAPRAQPLTYEIYTTPESFDAVLEALKAKGIETITHRQASRPSVTVEKYLV